MKPSKLKYAFHNFTISVVLLSLFYMSNSFAQYTDIKRLGTAQAMCKKPGVTTRTELQSFFANNPALITKLLNDAQWKGDIQDLLSAIANGHFTEKLYRPGTTFEWMGLRENGQPKASALRRWAGEEPFLGFEATLVQGCESYQFVIPKICCNLSLKDITISSDQPRLNVVIEGSSMRVCTDQNARLTLTGSDGASSGLSLDQDECWQGKDMTPGDYLIVAVAECGRSERSATIAGMPTLAAVQDDVKPSESLKITPFVAAVVGTETVMRLEEAWNMEMRDSSGIFGARAGVKVPLSKTLFLVPSIGALHRNGVNEGNIYPDDSVNIDLGLEQSISNNLFVGAGIGVWNLDDSDFREGSIFINIGGSITKSTEWFAEVRGIDSDNPDGNDGFSDNRGFSAGIRLLFD